MDNSQSLGNSQSGHMISQDSGPEKNNYFLMFINIYIKKNINIYKYILPLMPLETSTREGNFGYVHDLSYAKLYMYLLYLFLGVGQFLSS